MTHIDPQAIARRAAQAAGISQIRIDVAELMADNRPRTYNDVCNRLQPRGDEGRNAVKYALRDLARMGLLHGDRNAEPRISIYSAATNEAGK